MTVFNKPTKLNEVQMHFLQFLSQRQVSKQELEDIQRMIAQYYFDKAEIELEKIIQEIGSNADILITYDKHFKELDSIPFPKIVQMTIEEFGNYWER